jgi:hypothetical protein
MPLKPSEMGRIRDFLVKLLAGKADLGFGALSMVALYAEAKEAKVDFIDLLLSDEAMVERMITLLGAHAERISPKVISSMRIVIKAHDEAKLKKAQEPFPVPPPPGKPGQQTQRGSGFDV